MSETFVIRAGYGINEIPYSLGRSVLSLYPTTISPTYPSPNSLSWYAPLSQGIPAITLPPITNGHMVAPNNVNMSVLPRSFPWPYIQSWNVTLEKELRPGFTAQAGYVASRTVRSMTQDSGATVNLNAGQFIGAGQNGQPFFPTGGRTSNVSLYTPKGTIAYNSLQAALKRRFAQGLQFGAAWTWAKAESPVYPTDALLYQYLDSRPVQSTDRTHVLTMDAAWELPFGKGKSFANHGPGSAILGGWALNSLAVFYSGLPFSVTASSTSLNMPGASQQADQLNPAVQILGSVGGRISILWLSLPSPPRASVTRPPTPCAGRAK